MGYLGLLIHSGFGDRSGPAREVTPRNTNSDHTGSFGTLVLWADTFHIHSMKHNQHLQDNYHVSSAICYIFTICVHANYVLIYVHVHYLCIYIYIYIERERERDLFMHVSYCFTADFRSVLYQKC